MARIPRLTLLLMAICCLLTAENIASASLSKTLNLNYVSETLQPGQTANIQGGGFTATTRVQLQPVGATGLLTGTPTAPTIISGSTNLIQVQIPKSFAMGLWAVWLIDATGNVSTTRYINQAQGLRFNSDAVAPGGAIEVWGRNLGGIVPSTPSTITFVAPNQTSYVATASEADANHLAATVPTSLIPGTTYQVFVSNGLGGALGKTLVKAPLAIRKAGLDPLNLGVPWAADLTYIPANYLSAPNTYNVKTDPRLSLHAVGDGIHDDEPAIQAAIELAAKDSHGGGIVYVPAGTYLMASVPAHNANVILLYYLLMRPGVVLTGDGPGKTTLEGGIPNDSNHGLIYLYGDSLGGIANLTLVNLNTSGSSNQPMYNSGTATNRIFLKNIDFQMANCQQMCLMGITNLLIADSTFEALGTITFYGDPYLTLENNVFHYCLGRFATFGSDYILVRNNTFSRNGAYSKPGAGETGGIEISNDTAPVISANDFVVTPGALGGNNDGESILAQDASVGSFFRDIGTITATNGNVVSDSSKHWPVISPLSTRQIITITNGVAMGQWRYVTAITSNSVTIDHPWDFAPPPGSQYSLSGWTADRVFVLNNSFLNSIKGAVVFWEGAWYCTVSGNETEATEGHNPGDVGGIVLRACDRTFSPAEGWAPSVVKHAVVWANQITGNTARTATASKNMVIQIMASVINGPLHGNCTLNNEERNNLVDSEVFDANNKPILSSSNGYFAFMQSVNGPANMVGANAIVGTIYESNRSTNIPAPVYYLGVGLLQTITH